MSAGSDWRTIGQIRNVKTDHNTLEALESGEWPSSPELSKETEELRRITTPWGFVAQAIWRLFKRGQRAKL